MALPESAPSEVELKFLLSAKNRLIVGEDSIFARETTPADLVSVYYDTPEFDLHKNGLSLRVRRHRDSCIQTVKREAGLDLFDRGEWERKLHGQGPDRSAWLGTPAEPILDAKSVGPLTPIFSTNVRRVSRVVKDGPDLVEVSLDHGEIVAGPYREPIDELELELKGGDAAALFRIAHRIGERSVLRLSFESKSQRGYRLVRDDRSVAQKAGAVHIRPDMTGADAFAQVVRSCLAQVCSNAEILQASREAEVLHQLRVGLRRLRAALTTFKPILPGKELASLNAGIKWIGRELDPARDLDVLITNSVPSAKERAENDPLVRGLRERLHAAHIASYDRALEAIDSDRFALLLLKCAEWVEIGRWRRNKTGEVVKLRDGDAAMLAGVALGRLWRKLRKTGKHLGKLGIAARHRARIKAKKLRYAAEFFEDVFGKHTKAGRSKFIALLMELQDTLGELNDMASAHRTATAALGDDSSIAFGERRMIDDRKRTEALLLKKAVRAYARWKRAKPFW